VAAEEVSVTLPPLQRVTDPDGFIVGVEGAELTITGNVLGRLDPHPFATTVIFPLTAPAPAVNVIEFVVDVPVHPPGLVQVYVVAPVTGVILYTNPDVFVQTGVGP